MKDRAYADYTIHAFIPTHPVGERPAECLSPFPFDPRGDRLSDDEEHPWTAVADASPAELTAHARFLEHYATRLRREAAQYRQMARRGSAG